MSAQSTKIAVFSTNAYEQARSELIRSGWYILGYALPWFLIAMAAFTLPFLHLDVVRITAIVSVVLAVEVLMITRSGMSISVLQMQQVEESRLDNLRLIAALESLENELKRRPETKHVVNCSLFGTLKV